MKKCCNKILIPKIKYKASIVDSIGLIILLGFFLSIAALVALGLSAWLVSIAVTVDVSFEGLEDFLGLGSGVVLMLFGLYKFLPKLINMFSYFVNYSLRVTSTCKACNFEHVLAEYPKTNDPF